MNRVDKNVLQIFGGIFILLVILFNIPWLVIRNVTNQEPYMTIEISPWNIRFMIAGESIEIYLITILNRIFFAYLTMIGLLSIVSGMSTNTKWSRIISSVTKRKILYSSLIYIGTIFIMVIYLWQAKVIDITGFELLELNILYYIPTQNLYGMGNEIIIPMKIILGPGLILSLIAGVLLSIAPKKRIT